MSRNHIQIFRFILVCVLVFGGSLFAESVGLYQSSPNSNVVFRKVKSDRWGILNKHTHEDTLFDRALDQAVAGMSLEEKIGQMTQIDLVVIAAGETFALKQPVQIDAEKLKTAIEKYHVGSILIVGCGSGELSV